MDYPQYHILISSSCSVTKPFCMWEPGGYASSLFSNSSSYARLDDALRRRDLYVSGPPMKITPLAPC